MNRQHLLILILSVLAVGTPQPLCGQAFPVFGESHRDWTSAQGTVFRSRLIAVNDTTVKLASKGRVMLVPIASLSAESQTIARSMLPKDFGRIIHSSVDATQPQQRKFLENHQIEGMLWEGPWGGGEGRMPFLFHQPPDLKPGVKIPLLIHLHGTNGYGTNNLNPLFRCGGGIARSYFDGRFQKSSPCCVMIPQTTLDNRLWTGDLVRPPPCAVWLTHAVHLLAQDPDSPIDPKRVYVVGLSLGGMGVNQLLAKYPDFYAAGVAVAGFDGPDLFNHRNVRQDNFWVVANRHDTPYTHNLVREFEQRYRELGGTLRTTLPNADSHNAWSKFLGNHEYRTWLFRKELQGW